MIPPIIENIFSAVFNFANKFASGRYWHLKTAVLCTVLSLCLHFPNFTHGVKWMRNGINKQIEEPFAKQNYAPDSHLAKRTFRITMPVIGHLLNLNITGLLVLQSILGFLFFIIVSKLVFSITSDNILSLIVCIGFTVVYIGKSFLVDIGCFDGTAFFLLGLAMYLRNPLLIFICIFLACFTDERAIIASGMVILWWIVREKDFKTLKPIDLIVSNRYVISIIISLFAVLISRYLLNMIFDLKIPVELGGSLGLVQLGMQINIVLFGLFSGVEFFWILLFIGGLVLLHYKKYLLLSGYIFLAASIIITASIVADLTRSITYIFPMIFIALKIIHQEFSATALRKLMLTIVFISFVFGTYEIVGPKVWWIFPLPVQLITGGL